MTWLHYLYWYNLKTIKARNSKFSCLETIRPPMKFIFLWSIFFSFCNKNLRANKKQLAKLTYAKSRLLSSFGFIMQMSQITSPAFWKEAHSSEEVMRTVLCSRLGPHGMQSYWIYWMLFDLGVKSESWFFRSRWRLERDCFTTLATQDFFPHRISRSHWWKKSDCLISRKKICMKDSLMPLRSFGSGLGHPEWNIQKTKTIVLEKDKDQQSALSLLMLIWILQKYLH